MARRFSFLDAVDHERFSARRSRGEMVNQQHEVFDAHTPPDVTSVRAKSTGHGKKTADKWNQ